MGWLSYLLGCVTPAPPASVASSPSIVQPDRDVRVRVESYRELDISKVKDRQKFHSYITLALLDGDEAIRDHAVQDELKVNMLTSTLAKAGPLPLTVGQELTMTVVINTTSPPYVQVKKLQAASE